jgi:hypothetical protein
MFGNSFPLDQYPNILHLVDAGTTLTIGPGISVQGKNGVIGSGSGTYFSGPADVSVVNQGTMSCGVPGGTVLLQGQQLVNQGVLSAPAEGVSLDGSAQSSTNFGTFVVASNSVVNWPGDLDLQSNQYIASQAGGYITIGGDLLGGTGNADQYNPQGTLEFQSGFHFLEAMSQDRGSTANGFVKNFAYGTVLLDSGAQVMLVDQFTNSQGPPPECVYAGGLILSSGSKLDLNGLHLYAQLRQIAGTLTNGTVSQIPNGGGTLAINTTAGGSIPTAGTLDQWSFLGRAGEFVTVTVDTGGGGVIPPQINYALIQLFDPSANLVAQAGNAAPQQLAGIFNASLPVDGLYTVTVQAPATWNHVRRPA